MIIYKDEQELYIRDILVNLGVPEDDSWITSKSLTLANLRGIDSHGILRLPIYSKRLKLGLMDTKPNYFVEKEDDTYALIDGNNYIAQVSSRYAMEKAIEKAKDKTISVVVVKNSNHFGAASEYTVMAAEQGMIGIALSNTVPLMPPPGGADKVVGNNPLSISFPGGKFGIVSVDMAMSSVAQGKIRNAELNNQEVPIGWGIDAEGNDTTDPKKILNGGFLLPTGGPKGYGLALAIEVLTAAVTNSPISKEVKSIYQLEEKLGISHMFIVINFNKFTTSEDFLNKVELFLDIIKACPKAYGVDEIYFPGEIENNIMKNRLENGMVITEEMELMLNEISKEYDVKPIRDYVNNRNK